MQIVDGDLGRKMLDSLVLDPAEKITAKVIETNPSYMLGLLNRRSLSVVDVMPAAQLEVLTCWGGEGCWQRYCVVCDPISTFEDAALLSRRSGVDGCIQ